MPDLPIEDRLDRYGQVIALLFQTVEEHQRALEQILADRRAPARATLEVSALALADVHRLLDE